MNNKIFRLPAFIKALFLSLAAAVLLTSCLSHTKISGMGGTFTFVQICDPQLGFSDYSRDMDSLRQAVRQTNALRPDFVVICGDLVNTANAGSYADFKEIISGFQMPCYCVPGNHDVGNQPTPESLQKYRKIMGKDYFSFEHKGAAFVFVNTSLWKGFVEGESEKQDTWLKERLKDSFAKGQQIFIIGHFPLFCREADEPDEYMNLPMEKRAELLTLFEQCNVTAVLGGHAHKLTVNNYKNIQLVNAEATSKNLDGRPLGFRVWYVNGPMPPRHEFVPLD